MNEKELLAKFEEQEKALNSAKEKLADLEREKIASMKNSGETDERALLRKFGCSNVSQLLNTNTAAPKFAHIPLTDKLNVIELKKDLDISRWYAQMFDGQGFDRGELEQPNQIARVKLLDSRLAKSSDLAGRIKAFGTGVSGAGAEWIETQLSSNYVEEYLLEKKVPNLFQEIQMPSNPFKLNVAKDGTVAKIVAEGASASEQNFGTDSITFDAANKLVELYNLPEELNEDSAVSFLTLGRQMVLDSQIKALETALINGDTTATHMDTNALVGATDARRTFKGLRKLALANSANGVTIDFGGGVSEAKLDDMIQAMGKFAINPRECVIIVSPNIYHQMTALTNVLTVDKFGSMATILNGLLAAYKGKGIVASEYLYENMNASGVYDNTTTTKGGILMVNKTRFMLGRRRPIRIRVASDARAEYDRYQLVSYQRVDFQGHAQSSTEKSVAYGYNVTM
jgi:HK97 family phage major capsid protein